MKSFYSFSSTLTSYKYIGVVLIVALSLSAKNIYAQTKSFRCFMQDEGQLPPHEQPENDGQRSTTIVCDTTGGFRQFIRVNVHWVLTDAGTGNFRANDDGNGNSSITGYTKAEEMIDGANADLLANQQMWLPSGNSTPKMPIGIGFILNGVFFDKSTSARNATNGDWNLQTTLGKDKSNTINVYMMENPTYDGGGIACNWGMTCTNLPAVKLYGTWNNYTLFNNGWNHFQIRLLQHEIGHLLNLYHTWSFNDYCGDTPNNYNCWTYTSGSSTCGNWSQISNNIMDYNQWQPAYSPCQISRIIATITTTPGTNYIYNCSDCVPANANFTIGSQYCGNSPIAMDCRGSYQENNYFLEIYKTSTLTSTNVISGTFFSAWYSSQAPLISNLRTVYTPGFGNGIYRIKLAVQNFRPNSQPCNVWDEEVKYITSYVNTDCSGGGSGKNEESYMEDISLVDNLSMNVYPNPNNGNILIDVSILGQYRVLATNVNGQIVIDQTHLFEGQPLNLSIDNAGVYALHILSENYATSKKIIIIK